MPYIQPEVLEELKRIDLYTYLKASDPGELVHVSGNVYCTKTHDSLKISNGKWMWWSRGIGGRSALDYLIKVEGYSFLDAAEQLMTLGSMRLQMQLQEERPKEKILLLPEPSASADRVILYLKKRGISPELIRFCLETGRLYESRNYHNAVFVGMDRTGKPKYAALRGTWSDFVGEASGSDKNYSFAIPAETKSEAVHLFESPIDLLSYASIRILDGEQWRVEHLLSLAGVYQPAGEIKESKVPAALERFLKEHLEIWKVDMHLDNDQAGRRMTEALKVILPEKYQCQDKPPCRGKDFNDELCLRLGIPATKRREKRRAERS